MQISKYFKIILAVVIAGAVLLFAFSINEPQEKTVWQEPDWSAEQKAGQFFMVGFNGYELPEQTKNLLQQGFAGGVILMKYNLQDEEQIKNLTAQIQASNPHPEYPLLIAIDQEGGLVSRLPSMYESTAQAELNTVSRAYQVAYERGTQLKSLGINVNFSPVMDYIEDQDSFLYGRVFRGDRGQVADLGAAMVRGYQDAGIIACPKHYPGHHGEGVDSHKQLPSVDLKSMSYSDYVSQFSSLMSQSRPAMMMSGHIQFPDLDEYPASLSAVHLNYLRDSLAFQGVLITDDMLMGALQNNYDPAQAADLAFGAGNDILLYVGAGEEYEFARRRLTLNFSEVKTRQSLRRILALKKQIAGFAK